LRRSLRAVPAWGWLAAIVAGSFALRAWLGRGMLAPFIMVDELIFADLARSLAAGEGLRVRDEPFYLSLGYPLLIAPAYALFDALPTAYAAVKTINALLMSLAAVPTYLLARRLLAPGLSLAAAALAVVIPSMAYTGTVMTENAFYPLFVTCVLLLVLVLERPTLLREAALFGCVGLALVTRAQALALLPAILLAPILLVILDRRPMRSLERFWRVYAAVAAGTLLVIGAQTARGGSLSELLGAYAVVGTSGYDLGEVARYFLYHLAELDLYLGVLPVAALVVVTARARRLGPNVPAFVAAALAVSVSVLVVVAAFASVFISTRIQERNTFFLAPLFLIALLVWVGRGAPRPRALAGAAAVGAALLPLTIPFERFIETGATSDTLALLPIWSAYGSLLFDSIDATVLVGGALAVGLFLLVPRRYILLVPAATLLYLAVVSYNVWFGERGFKQASVGALYQGIRTDHRDWIDDAVPDGAEVAILWTGLTDRFTVNQNEFFNRSVGPIYYVGAPTLGGLAETATTVSADGDVRLPDGSQIQSPYLLVDGTISPEGDAIARDPGWGMTLWRLDGPLVVVPTRITGLYPGDSWSAEKVTWTRGRCRGGTLTVVTFSDPALFHEPQTITARIGGRVVKRIRLNPTGFERMSVRLEAANGTCRVVFEVSPTAIPAEATNGENPDARVLGAHFSDFRYSR
jgi:hypothetical protein